MKIAFLIRSLALAHGVERTLADKVNALSEMGHEVTLITYEQGTHPLVFPLRQGVRHVDLDCCYFHLYRKSLLRRLIEGVFMRRRFQRRLSAAVSQLQLDVLVTTTYSDEFARATMSLHRKVCIVVESHTAYSIEMEHVSAVQRWRSRHALHAYRHCHLFIALTRGDAEFWKKHAARVTVVPNPLPFYCEDISLAHRKPGRILCVGSFQSQKRHDRLVDAFSLIADKYKNWYVDIIGDGVLKDTLQQRIDRLGLTGRVTLLPPTADVRAEYLSCEFLVQCSDYEGFGLVLVEAMACGVPVVSTACPYGPAEIIDDGITGLLTKLDVADLSAKMEWMILHDAERREMGIKAHKAVLRYRKQQIMREWAAAYASVM